MRILKPKRQQRTETFVVTIKRQRQTIVQRLFSGIDELDAFQRAIEYANENNVERDLLTIHPLHRQTTFQYPFELQPIN